MRHSSYGTHRKPNRDRHPTRIARGSTEHQSLDQQTDALAAAGVEGSRVYSDKLSGTSTRQQRPGLAALLDYAREGDAIVVVGIDRLGRNAAEVMTTIRELGERGIVLRSLREGIDTSNASGRMVAGVLRVSPSLNWNSGVNAVQQRGTHDGRVGSPSVAPRRWINRKWPWRSGCTRAASRRARSRPRSASVVPPCIASSPTSPTPKTSDRPTVYRCGGASTRSWAASDAYSSLKEMPAHRPTKDARNNVQVVRFECLHTVRQLIPDISQRPDSRDLIDLGDNRFH